MKTLVMMLLTTTTMMAYAQKNGNTALPDYSDKNRSEVPTEYTWKLEDIYAKQEDWYADKQKLSALSEQIGPLAKEWTSSPQKMLALLELNTSIGLLSSKLGAYTNHNYNSDMSNSVYQNMSGELKPLSTAISSKFAFFSEDVLALGKQKFDEYCMAEPKLKEYRFMIDKILRKAAHILPKDQQKIVSMTRMFGSVGEDASQMLNDVEIPPADLVLANGDKVALTLSNYLKHRASANMQDRKNAFQTYWSNKGKYNNTFAVLFDGGAKRRWFIAHVYNYKSCLEAKLYDENIPADVYLNLIKYVRENLKPMHDYIQLKKQILKLDTFYFYDLYASAVASVDKIYPYADAKDMVYHSVKALGDEYLQNLKLSLDNRWIDVYPNKGKESGAYSSGLYGVHPFVKMNYQGRYNDVATLAHELGHAMHSYLSAQNQPYNYARYSTFIAEIASTFNENMLLDYVLKNETDDLFKLYILDKYIDDIRGTLYQQTFFAEFELNFHRRIEEGKPLTADWLNQEYLRLCRFYYGHDNNICQVPDVMQYGWGSVPHFFMNYYVFQYSTGIIASLALSQKVLNGDKTATANYLTLLKSGGNDFPINQLDKTGVKMTTEEPYQQAFQRFTELVKQMEVLVKKLQKEGKL